MADPKLSDQLKVSAVKSVPVLIGKALDYGYRGVVISIHFINQLLRDAFFK